MSTPWEQLTYTVKSVSSACQCDTRCSVSQSCLTLCDPMDCSSPGSSVHGIFQARLLEWVAIWVTAKSTQGGIPLSRYCKSWALRISSGHRDVRALREGGSGSLGPAHTALWQTTMPPALPSTALW